MYRLGQLFHFGTGAHVAHMAVTAAACGLYELRGLFQSGLINVHQPQLGSATGKFPGGGLADTGTSAGYQGNFVIEINHAAASLAWQTVWTWRSINCATCCGWERGAQ